MRELYERIDTSGVCPFKGQSELRASRIDALDARLLPAVDECNELELLIEEGVKWVGDLQPTLQGGHEGCSLVPFLFPARNAAFVPLAAPSAWRRCSDLRPCAQKTNDR